MTVVLKTNSGSVFSFGDHNRVGCRDGMNKVKGMVDFYPTMIYIALFGFLSHQKGILVIL